jgi:hypothetical protein
MWEAIQGIRTILVCSMAGLAVFVVLSVRSGVVRMRRMFVAVVALSFARAGQLVVVIAL